MSVAAAVLTRLGTWAAAQPSLVQVFDTTIPGQPQADPTTGLGRYVIVAERTSRRSTSVSAVSADAAGELYVTSAAWLVNLPDSAAPACRYLVAQVQQLLTDWVPTVSGFSFGPLRQSGEPHLLPEETLTDRHLIYAVDQFSYTGTYL